MSTVATAVPQQAPISIWSGVRTTLNSIFGAVVAASRTVERTMVVTEHVVILAENEVINIDEMQQIRLDATREERKVQQAQFTSAMRKVKRVAKK